MDWLPAAFDWVRDLATDPRVARLGLRFLTEGESNSARDSLLGDYEQSGPLGTMQTSETLEASRQLCTQAVAVAEGPVIGRGPTGGAIASWYVFGNCPIKTLLFSPGDALPPVLWVPAGASFASVLGGLLDHLEPAVPEGLDPAKFKLGRTGNLIQGCPGHPGSCRPKWKSNVAPSTSQGRSVPRAGFGLKLHWLPVAHR